MCGKHKIVIWYFLGFSFTVPLNISTTIAVRRSEAECSRESQLETLLAKSKYKWFEEHLKDCLNMCPTIDSRTFACVVYFRDVNSVMDILLLSIWINEHKYNRFSLRIPEIERKFDTKMTIYCRSNKILKCVSHKWYTNQFESLVCILIRRDL